DNGVQWLLAHHTELMKAAFVLNADGGGVDSIQGKPRFLGVDASQKIYADFQLSLTNPGGHSSLPVPDNAIYQLAAALGRIQRLQFPFELNSVTRGYFSARAALDAAAGARQIAGQERAILAAAPPEAAFERLAGNPAFNALLRTTCVATRLAAGDANNALPQNAEALVNCRILPGHSAAAVQRQLAAAVAGPKIRIQFMAEDTSLHDQAPQLISNPPQQLDPAVLGPLAEIARQMWNIPVVPAMATGASDSKYTLAAGIPSYDVIGVAVDEGGDRAHGRDENLRITSFDQGAEFCYRLLKLLAPPR
ncbi:MAG: M20/M25/M40 family metallo-hydrolase, partial [Terriglobales bacterium]